MKVALISEWLDAWRGGAETSTLQFLHQMIDRGVELHVFTRSRPSPAPGLSVHTISGASMSRTRRSVTFAHRVERLLRGESFDVIHAISPCKIADIYQPRGGTVAETIERNLALIRSAPLRCLKRCANQLNFKQRYMLAMERAMLRDHQGPLVVAISDYVRDQLQRHYALGAERVRKIYNGVDSDPADDAERSRNRTAIRGEFGVSEGDLLVLVVAHNFRLKGVLRWMEALSLLGERGIRGIRTIIVGKGESERWHRHAARLCVADHVTFTGPSERVRQFHHAADVLVHPTYYDPCSRVVLEAMVAGLPCVTTRWDGASEMIKSGVNGFVIDDPGDVPDLAARVDQLRDATLRRRLGGAAAEVRERVSMARHADEMMILYEETASAEGRRT